MKHAHELGKKWLYKNQIICTIDIERLRNYTRFKTVIIHIRSIHHTRTQKTVRAHWATRWEGRNANEKLTCSFVAGGLTELAQLDLLLYRVQGLVEQCIDNAGHSKDAADNRTDLRHQMAEGSVKLCANSEIWHNRCVTLQFTLTLATPCTWPSAATVRSWRKCPACRTRLRWQAPPSRVASPKIDWCRLPCHSASRTWWARSWCSTGTWWHLSNMKVQLFLHFEVCYDQNWGRV